MKKIYIASGFNSWTNKQLTKAFLTEKEAIAAFKEATQ
jgi:hypothetical protein